MGFALGREKTKPHAQQLPGALEHKQHLNLQYRPRTRQIHERQWPLPLSPYLFAYPSHPLLWSPMAQIVTKPWANEH